MTRSVFLHTPRLHSLCSWHKFLSISIESCTHGGKATRGFLQHHHLRSDTTTGRCLLLFVGRFVAPFCTCLLWSFHLESIVQQAYLLLLWSLPIDMGLHCRHGTARQNRAHLCLALQTDFDGFVSHDVPDLVVTPQLCPCLSLNPFLHLFL